ncbi:MAG: GSU2086 family protein [Armatimonadota bacterium]
MTDRLDRKQLIMHPLSERANQLNITKMAVSPSQKAAPLSSLESGQVAKLAASIKRAKANGRPVMMTYGAHLVKNGLAPVVIKLIEQGWITHLATNGAGTIHDWEFAYLGQSSEDVRVNAAKGQFGAWEETGRYINLAILLNGIDGLGYGWSVGKMIATEQLTIPSVEQLKDSIRALLDQPESDDTLSALSDALTTIQELQLEPGQLAVKHAYKRFSIQNAAWAHQVPFTVHPGIGYDIIHTHPACCGGALGRGAIRDFLSYAECVSRLSGGVHMSVGSAIMAPMVFEKSLSMANNLAIQRTGQPITDHTMAVVDIQDGGGWDWSQGEPPKDNPAYYLRFCKTFHRMGGTLDYLCMDNKQFLLSLYHELNGESPA